MSPTGRPQLPSRSALFEPLAITSPIVFLGKMTIAPRLVLRTPRRVDWRRISVPSTTRRHWFASLPALLLQPRAVIAPIALFVGAMVPPRLILQSPSVFRIDDRIECPHHRLQAVGRGGASDSDRDRMRLVLFQHLSATLLDGRAGNGWAWLLRCGRDRLGRGFPNAGYEPHPSCGDCPLTSS